MHALVHDVINDLNPDGSKVLKSRLAAPCRKVVLINRS